MLLYDGFGCHAADAVCNLSQIARGDIQEVGIIGYIAPLLEVGGYGLGEIAVEFGAAVMRTVIGRNVDAQILGCFLHGLVYRVALREIISNGGGKQVGISVDRGVVEQ